MASKPLSLLSIVDLTVAYRHKIVLDSISFKLHGGQLLAIIGPNGAGKTTLLKTILGFIEPKQGSMVLDGKSLTACYHLIAYVPQRATVDWDFPITVFQVVLMGTYGRLGWFARPGKREYQQAQEALDQVDLLAHRNTPIGQLSGGQQQRVFLARALAQDAQVYILDEPFTGVDQVTESIMITRLHALKMQGKTIMVVHHDIQTVAEYFDTVLLLNAQQIAFGPTNQVLTPQYICAAYGNRNVFSFQGINR